LATKHPHPLAPLSQDHDAPKIQNFAPSIIHPPTVHYSSPPLTTSDVYIDDFIELAQPAHAKEALHIILNSISDTSIMNPIQLPYVKTSYITIKAGKGR
jgi:hypothetical protein